MRKNACVFFLGGGGKFATRQYKTQNLMETTRGDNFRQRHGFNDRQNVVSRKGDLGVHFGVFMMHQKRSCSHSSPERMQWINTELSKQDKKKH